MKTKLLNLFLIMLPLLICSACSSSDDDNTETTDIIGKWNAAKVEYTKDGMQVSIDSKTMFSFSLNFEFYSNGKGVISISDLEAKEEESLPFNYNYSQGYITGTIISTKGETYKFKIKVISINDSVMIVEIAELDENTFFDDINIQLFKVTLERIK